MLVNAGDKKSFCRLVDTVRRGGVAIIPCDTIYGIVGIAPDTEQKIRRIKGRGKDSPFVRLIQSADWLPGITDQKLPAALHAYWPGPLTLIFTSREGGSVALRVPKDDQLQRLLTEIGRPLFSTSVNRSQEKALWRIKDIIEQFEHKVDLIVSAGDIKAVKPSTIIDITRSPFRLLRQGVLELPDSLFLEK